MSAGTSTGYVQPTGDPEAESALANTSGLGQSGTMEGLPGGKSADREVSPAIVAPILEQGARCRHGRVIVGAQGFWRSATQCPIECGLVGDVSSREDETHHNESEDSVTNGDHD